MTAHISCFTQLKRKPLAAKELHEEEGEGREEGEQAEKRELVAGPRYARTLGRPEGAEGRQQEPDSELDRVLWDARERRVHEHSDGCDEHERRSCSRCREPEPSLRAPERDHDERDFEALE